MTELSIDIFVSVDGFAFGTRSPGYFGFDGPDLEAWITEQAERPHRADLFVALGQVVSVDHRRGWGHGGDATRRSGRPPPRR